jgi:O-antigen/teichoic acid export membrane protein
LIDRENKLYFASLIVNVFLFISVIKFIIFLVAPLLGGILIYRALIINASWVGMALMLKYVSNKSKKRIQLKKVELLFIMICGIVCISFLFKYPFNIFFCTLLVVGCLVGYRAQLTSFNKNENITSQNR